MTARQRQRKHDQRQTHNTKAAQVEIIAPAPRIETTITKIVRFLHVAR